MGFPTSLADYGTDCPVGCWPADKTPDIIYVSFSGLRAGENWTPLAAFPPTAFLSLPQFTSTQWLRIIHPWRCVLNLNASYTELELWHTTFGTAFYSKPLTSCTWQFDNEITSPVGNIWYGGRAQLGWCPDTGTASIQKVMKLIGIKPDPLTYAQFWRSSPGVMCQLIAGKPGDTNLLILFDYTP